MLGTLNNDADVMVHLQGVGKLIRGMQRFLLCAMHLEGVGCVPNGELNFAGFE